MEHLLGGTNSAAKAAPVWSSDWFGLDLRQRRPKSSNDPDVVHIAAPLTAHHVAAMTHCNASNHRRSIIAFLEPRVVRDVPQAWQRGVDGNKFTVGAVNSKWHFRREGESFGADCRESC